MILSFVLCDGEGDAVLLTAAVDHNLHRVAHVQIVDRAVQGVHGGHIGSVDAEENVAFFNALGGQRR